MAKMEVVKMILVIFTLVECFNDTNFINDDVNATELVKEPNGGKLMNFFNELFQRKAKADQDEELEYSKEIKNYVDPKASIDISGDEDTYDQIYPSEEITEQYDDVDFEPYNICENGETEVTYISHPFLVKEGCISDEALVVFLILTIVAVVAFGFICFMALF